MRRLQWRGHVQKLPPHDGAHHIVAVPAMAGAIRQTGRTLNSGGTKSSNNSCDLGLAMQLTARRTMPHLQPTTAMRQLGGRAGEFDEVTPMLRAVRDGDVAEPPGVAHPETGTPDLDSALTAIFRQDSVRRSLAGLAAARRRHRSGRRRPSRGTDRGSAQGVRGPAGAETGALAAAAGSLREARLIEALVTLADSQVVGYDLADSMGYLVDVCTELLDATAVGLVLADGRGGLEVVATSGEQAELLELVQLRTGNGPCWDCVSTGAVQSVSDVTAWAERWPQFARLALDQGIRSVHVVPLRLREKRIGALSTFRAQPGLLNEADCRVVQALADVATIGVLQQRSSDEFVVVKDQLERALSSRVVIEQAKGLLSQFGGVDMEEAFAEMRSYARRHRVALTELAQALVDRRRRPGDILDAPARAPRTTR